MNSDHLINTIVLKIASRCNIDCTYCYEYNRGDESWRAQPKMLSLENAHLLAMRISEYCEFHGIAGFNISLHGGEPTLVGAKNLDKILEILSKNCRVKLRFGMQTNGTLITNELIEVLKLYSVRVAVSLDGGKEHNQYRVSHSNRPTWNKAISGLNLIKGAGLFSGFQVVVNLDSEPGEVLRELSIFQPPEIELGQPFGTYDNPPSTKITKHSLSEWYSQAFDYWVNSEELAYTKITILHSILSVILGGAATSEWFSDRPPGYIIVTTNGDYEGLDTLKVVGERGRVLGMHMNKYSLLEAVQHPQIRERTELSFSRPTICRKCPIVDWCNGGYYPTRFSKMNGFDNPSIYCRDWKKLFSHIALWAAKNIDNNEMQKDIVTRIDSLKLMELENV